MTATRQNKLNKGGAPKNNCNAVTHGQRAVTMGNLPRPARYVQKLVSRFRARQESLAREHLGLAVSDSLPDRYERRINTATSWEQRALLAQLQLRVAMDKLSPVEVVQMAEYVCTSREKRDAALRALGMEDEAGGEIDPWADTAEVDNELHAANAGDAHTREQTAHDGPEAVSGQYASGNEASEGFNGKGSEAP